MKYLITFFLLITMITSGLTSYHLFRLSDYPISEMLIVASYLSIVLGIYVMTARQKKQLIG